MMIDHVLVRSRLAFDMEFGPVQTVFRAKRLSFSEKHIVQFRFVGCHLQTLQYLRSPGERGLPNPQFMIYKLTAGQGLQFGGTTS